MISARFIARKSGAAFVAVAGAGIEAMIGGVGAAEVGAAACGVAGRLLAGASVFLLQPPQSNGARNKTPTTARASNGWRGHQKSKVDFMRNSCQDNRIRVRLNVVKTNDIGIKTVVETLSFAQLRF